MDVWRIRAWKPGTDRIELAYARRDGDPGPEARRFRVDVIVR